jgi:hypothetical protein
MPFPSIFGLFSEFVLISGRFLYVVDDEGIHLVPLRCLTGLSAQTAPNMSKVAALGQAEGLVSALHTRPAG